MTDKAEEGTGRGEGDGGLRKVLGKFPENGATVSI